MSTQAAVFRRVIKAVEKAVKEDRNHRIRIERDYCAGEFDAKVFGKEVPDYDCKHFRIILRTLWVKKSEGELVIDGASLCPDKIGSLDMAWGYIPHDLMYLHLEDMENDEAWRAAGWTQSELRRLADLVLAQGIIKAGRVAGGAWSGIGGAVARVVHAAVRAFGGIYHKFALALMVGALAASLCGCSGCAVPSGFTPADDAPPYTVEKVGEGD